ncbi:bifunctional 3-(3-hydroxy-phenyl)propionate/3-hydroxycinnamic acid hydroxylase MhpA [Eoetvoesiella caeni]|uniref:Single-component resorcinol 4-hydroxylase n=1 Tax=Eoetvoesiella caeni TaxID=645616 RepID=A0A366HD75_9BURK|nr:bifunctional 3-(3-hydroxy-phenyl)propionate/3-hydroxycinnamic acid hydroxylase [Eoetvoesiella caeni]MCI2809161.1 bifunctional 3-(3-hydroxy-phenyl)propionate/3-hydroxycinnamic acid hydroxylase [Eoetvoesiella caeni]NYT54303.1 bifunctional 3-(3-hydroxy-phenyl)propionate/3-hydroxycinnamic acid hydroxylase [Eoetvoesiella caeni]RBP39512.1 single-component resorcinol 4-hydroxylase [Eoetvoesiella caeni]
MSDEIFDVVQIGYGPVGQALAAMLGQRGHNVAVFERHSSLYALPRAGHFDHEIMRIFQSVGCAEQIEEDVFPATKYQWRNGKGETLITFDWDQVGVSGWMSDYLMFQPYLENALHHAVQQYPTVSVNHGWEAVEITTHADHVSLELRQYMVDAQGRQQATGETKTVKGRYLVGADGANSFVRQHLNLPWTDLGFNESWVVLDLKQKGPVHYEFDNGQICDPKRPLCLFQLGKSHRRFEYMVMPGEDRETLLRPEHAWETIRPWMAPDDADLIRQIIYTFKSGLASQWSKDRVFLVGDAAHLMPPFLGQGMCSGVRDAKNLAWKLDLVLKDKADAALLETYQQERSPHVKEIIDLAVQVGKISCMVDPEAAEARDQAFRDGAVPPPPPFPILRDGLIDHSAEAHSVTGELGPQGQVRHLGKEGRCDDVLGLGWQLISNFDVDELLSDGSRELLQLLETRVIRPIPVVDEPNVADAVVDIDGTYFRYFSANNVSAILVRPDFYVFGGVQDKADIDALILRLRDGFSKRND